MSIIIKKVDSNSYEVNGQICQLGWPDKNGIRSLKLPDNDMNRQWIKESVLDKAQFPYIIDKVKESRAESAPKSKNWEAYLTDEERETIENIKARCEERAKDMAREALEAKIAEIQAQLAKLNQ